MNTSHSRRFLLILPVWIVLSIGCSSGQPVSTTNTAGTGEEASEVVAMGGKPALVRVRAASGVDSEQAQIELTVQATKVSPAERFLVNVFFVADGPGGEARSRPAEQRLLGTFSFFPPPRPGETRKFLIGAPRQALIERKDFDVRVELVASTPEGKLENSALRILDAKVVF